MADLGRDTLEGAAGNGNRGNESGVAIALHDLRARLVGAKTECSQCDLFNLRGDLAVGADRA